MLDLLGLLLLWTRIVVCNFDPDLSCIFALTTQGMPNIILSSTRNDHLLQIDPSLANNLSLLVIVEYRNFELIVVGRVVDCKPELLVPAKLLAKALCVFAINLAILVSALLGDPSLSSLPLSQALLRNRDPVSRLTFDLGDSSRDRQ